MSRGFTKVHLIPNFGKVNPKKIIYLPNTAGCFTSEEALRTLRLAREMGGWKLIKLEVLADKKTLYPNMIETLKSTKILVKEGFKVMVYCTDNPLLAKNWKITVHQQLCLLLHQ